jgi:hypothetical protein
VPQADLSGSPADPHAVFVADAADIVAEGDVELGEH